MNLNDLAREVHENAKAKGFYDEPPTFMDRIALMHSELSEAVEEFRDGHAPNDERYISKDGHGRTFVHREQLMDVPAKPEGIPSEFADVIIRVLDACAFYGIDIDRAVAEKHAFNKTRPVKHGRARL